MRIALVHDYLTQRGGAERVALEMAHAFPDAPLYTALYEPASTFPEFQRVDVRPLALNSFRPLRADHRRALPLLAPLFQRLSLDARVVLCSSSGWSHGVTARHSKIVYCHTPARWLYQRERYVQQASLLRQLGLGVLAPRLRSWDRRAALSASRYLANSTVVKDRIRDVYGLESDLLPPPYALAPSEDKARVPGVAGGFLLCVGRLMPYKNVDAVIQAFMSLPTERLVVVGTGPERERLRAMAPANVRMLDGVDDSQLRWLYQECRGIVAASYEDFGLTPLEGAAFGKPTVALRFGGYMDTVRQDVTGVFFAAPRSSEIAGGVRRLLAREWDPAALQEHARGFGPDRFVDALRSVVEEEEARLGSRPASTGACR